MASKRGYITQEELAEYADITIVDATEADDQISQAEELIDAYVGPQKKAYPHELKGRAAGGASLSITLQANQQNIFDIDFFKCCEIEIIGGTGAGQRSVITGNTLAGVLTVASAWGTTPDSTSFYRIYQLGKFPRAVDSIYYSEQSPSTYYKNIPEAVKRATAAQVEYRIAMGDNFFKSDQADKQSEDIGDYSYKNAPGIAGVEKLIAPKAKILLRGLKTRLGEIIA
jgi:hypothetical protein